MTHFLLFLVPYIAFNICLCSFTFRSVCSLVTLSVPVILSILLHIYISKASRLLLSACVGVHVLAHYPLVATVLSDDDNDDDDDESGDDEIVCVLFTTALSPNVDSYVFVKVVNDVAGIVIEEETTDAGYNSFLLLLLLSVFGDLTAST